MKILSLSQTPLEEIIATTRTTLQKGGLVIYPTETVYGVGVDATNPTAVEKLLAYKSRREGKPLSIAVSNAEMAKKYVEINDQAKKLYQQFLPGPFTIISHGLHTTAPGVESEFGTLGIRIPDYDLILKIVEAFDKPITAPSANSSGKKRPYSVEDVLDALSEKQKNLIDLILDAGTLPKNLPSTVIDTTLSTPITVRKGDVEVGNTQTTYELISQSDSETQNIAGKLLLKNWETLKNEGLVIGLNGSLGMGKTVFARGSAKFLKIEEIISSPTYSYIQEYEYNRHGVFGNFFHLDVWKIDSKKSCELLEIPKLLSPGNLILIEWWSQIQNFLPADFRIKVLSVNFSSDTVNHRTLTISL